MGKLKGIVHDLAHSFTSLMNYHPGIDNYIGEYIACNMAKLGINKVEIDVMNISVDPPELALKPILESIEVYRDFLEDLLEKSGRTIDDIKSARIVITRTGRSEATDDTKWYIYEAYGEIALKSGETSRSKTITSHWLEEC